MTLICDGCQNLIYEPDPSLCLTCGRPVKQDWMPKSLRLKKLITQLFKITTQLAPFSLLDYAQGVDVSHWQGQMDWVRAKSAGAQFAFIKASENLWTDPQFHRNCEELQRIGIPFGTYHFCRPEYESAVKQGVYFANLTKNCGLISPVMDFERSGGKSPVFLAQWILDFKGAAEDILGRALKIVYTRQTIWDRYVEDRNWNRYFDLWAARYSSNLTSPWSDGYYEFRDWDTWTFWQYSADGNMKGLEFGAQSSSIDINRFNGTHAQFLAYINQDELPVEPPPPPPPQPVVEGIRMELLPDSWNIRSSPAVKSTNKIGTLEKGDIVNVIDIAGPEEVWGRIDDGSDPANQQWVALIYYGGSRYFKKV